MTDDTQAVSHDATPDDVLGSLPIDLRQRLRYVSQMSQGVALAGDAAINTPIDVRQWLVHPVELVDEHTGEVVSHQRLVLSDGADVRISTLSPSVVQAWGLVTRTLGDGPYDPPVRVEIREAKSRRGMAFRTLIVLD